MSGSIADLHQQAVAMLQASGAPMTAENLNRASLAISQGAGSMQPDMTAEAAAPAMRGGGRMNAAINRSAGIPTPPQQAPNPNDPNMDGDPTTGMPPEQAAEVQAAAPVAAAPTARVPVGQQLMNIAQQDGAAYLQGPMSPVAWAGGGMRVMPGGGGATAGNALMPPPNPGGPQLGVTLAPRPGAPAAPAALAAPAPALPAPQAAMNVMDALPAQSLSPRTMPTGGVVSRPGNNGGLRERIAQRNVRNRSNGDK